VLPPPALIGSPGEGVDDGGDAVEAVNAVVVSYWIGFDPIDFFSRRFLRSRKRKREVRTFVCLCFSNLSFFALSKKLEDTTNSPAKTSPSEEAVDAVDQFDAFMLPAVSFDIASPDVVAVVVAAGVIAATVVAVVVEAPAAPWLPLLVLPSPPLPTPAAAARTLSFSNSSGSKLKLGLEELRGIPLPVTVVVDERIRTPPEDEDDGLEPAPAPGAAPAAVAAVHAAS
jgi:hypothetical protein